MAMARAIVKRSKAVRNIKKITTTQRLDQFSDMPTFAQVETLANHFITEFATGKLDSVHVAYMNFHSAGVQKAEVMTLLPLAGVAEPKDAKATKGAITEQVI